VCSWGFHVLYAVRDAMLVHSACPATRHGNAVTLASALQCSQLKVALTSPDNGPAAGCVQYLDNYDKIASVFVVQFNDFMSLTSYFDVKYRY
jgi:hypothetical protein